MTDYSAFEQTIVDHWPDFAPQLVWADRLEEDGEADAARGVRWAAENGKWCNDYPSSLCSRQCSWFYNVMNVGGYEPSDIPNRVHRRLQQPITNGGSKRTYPCWLAAFRDLGRALLKVNGREPVESL